jgi:arylsulfate sulfotransferase
VRRGDSRRLERLALLAASAAAFACSSPAHRADGGAATGGASGSGDVTATGGIGGMTGNAAGIGGTPATTGGTAGMPATTGGTAGMQSSVGGSAGMPAVTGGVGGSSGTAGSSTAGTAGRDIGTYDVTVNPYATNPLSAVVNLHDVDASDVASVEVVVTGQDGAADFTNTYAPTDTELADRLNTADLAFPESGYHVPVYGLYAERTNDVRIHVARSAHDAVDLTVPIATPLANPSEDAWVPAITVDTAIPERMEPGWTVAEINEEPYPAPAIVFVEWTRYIAFDERGAIRWALRFDDLPKGETFTLRRSIGGNFWTGSLDTLIEVTKLGRVTRTLKVSDHTLNHELIQIGSADNCEGTVDGTTSKYAGNLLVLASKNGASTIQDRILELDAESGTLLNDWDLTQVLDPTRTTFVDPEQWAPGAGDWLHDNGLAYSAADESIIVSGRHQGVAKIRRDGTLVWLLAPHKGWNEPQLDRLLTAVDASGTPYDDSVQLGDEAAGNTILPEFDWAFGQHSPALLPNGDLLLFDNGISRHFGPQYASNSRVVIYRIDEAAMTVRQMGQYELTKQESSYYVSDAYQLPTTGNVFIQPGGSPINPATVKELTTEVAADGTVTFDTLVFGASLDLSWADPSRWYAYSYRGHRWVF